MFDKTFIATRFLRYGGYLHSLREANDETREVIGYALEDKILERTPVKDAEVSMLFTYMHRRFGIPSLGGDDYKDLSAGWLITTPVEDLALIVTPSFAGMGFSFRPVLDLPTKGRGGLEDVKGDRLQTLAEAYERTLLDLLRPVIQRDMDFNVLGEISIDNPAPDWAEPDKKDEDTIARLPRYHETCGLPMPDGVFGNKDWQQVLALLGNMGGGDISAGMEAFVKDAEARAFDRAAQARPEIMPVIAAGFYLARIDTAKDKAARLGIDDDDPRVSEFNRVAYGHGFKGQPSGWILELSGDDVLEAAEFVEAFGIGTHFMKKAVDNLVFAQRYHIEWSRFSEVSGGEFDEDLIPDVPYVTNKTAAEWRKNLALSGDAAVSAWAEAAASDPLGVQVLGGILSRLHHQKLTEARKAAVPSA